MEQILAYLLHLLDGNQFLQGGFVLGAITWIGYQLKVIPTFMWNKLKYYATYQAYFDQSTDIYDVFATWLNEKHPNKFRNVEVKFSFDSQNSLPSEPVQNVGGGRPKPRWSLKKFQFTDSNVIFYAGRWLWIRKERQKLEHVNDWRGMFLNTYTISGFFAKSAIDSLCQELLQRKIAEIGEDTLRVFFNEGNYFNEKQVETVKPFKHIFFAQKDEYLDDLNKFIAKKEFYKSKGINYKRSYLLYGPGGTGKTSIAIATAHFLGYDLYSINLAGVQNDHELAMLGQRIHKKSVILMEDIDCVLTDRNVKNTKLNFSTVLNFLDGLYAPSDCVFIMTTNKPEVLDEALTRKGRVDLSLLINYPTTNQIAEFMKDFYGIEIEFPVGFELNKPMSEVQDICLRNQIAQNAIIEILNLANSANGALKQSAAKV